MKQRQRLKAKRRKKSLQWWKRNAMVSIWRRQERRGNGRGTFIGNDSYENNYVLRNFHNSNILQFALENEILLTVNGCFFSLHEKSQGMIIYVPPFAVVRVGHLVMTCEHMVKHLSWYDDGFTREERFLCIHVRVKKEGIVECRMEAWNQRRNPKGEGTVGQNIWLQWF